MSVRNFALQRRQATPRMSNYSDVPRLNRGKLMRQIAALHAQMATSFREDGRPRLTDFERQEIMRQIVALETRLRES